MSTSDLPESQSDRLEEYRQHIDAVDREIVSLVNRRAKLARKIGAVKDERNDTIYKPHREQAVYKNVLNHNKGPLEDGTLRAIFREIMSGCRTLEKPITISYLGPEGTFTHWAARSEFGESVDYKPAGSLEEVFDDVEKKRASYGVVPVENSTEGGIRETLARLLESPLKACAEIVFEIHHSLLANCPDEDIQKVYSKGTVFRQTRKWLRNHLKDIRYVETESTGKAAQKASEEHNTAAIGHIDLAEKYQLNVIAENIEDMPHNVTRFFVLGHNISEPSGNDKTAILCSVADKVGALHDLLSPFKKHKINMTKIESFPSQSAAWQYYFFIDFIGHPDEPHVAKALEDIKKNCKNLRVIGAFPRGNNQ